MNSEIAKERMSEVVRVDTITTSEADFLATHVKMKYLNICDNHNEFAFEKGNKNFNENAKSTEDEIYNKYICNPENNHQFILVVGDNGTGKSHLIRWFDAKLKQESLENEVVLFIRRSDNSLKGTIKQLLEKPEVQNIPNKDIYERLVKANATLNEEIFKDRIYHNFIIGVDNDRDDKINHALKTRFSALLNDSIFKEHLMGSGKAIERIYAKVSADNKLNNQDVIALFDEEDFNIDDDLLEEIDNSEGSRKAYNLALELSDDHGLVKTLVEYINGFVDNVIQTCAGIEPGDFEQVFLEIRKEIKRQGKNLTLLIEDITAFTGINIALLNVLSTEHTGENAAANLCRLSSIVGITIQYFNDVFRDNQRDRISKYIFIPNDVFGTEPHDLYEFVGRYLNTMSLERDVVESWARKGNLSSDYPVHDLIEGKNWDFVKIGDNKELCLYPFTKKAILNLYEYSLKPIYHTPRYLLRYVVERTVSDCLYNKNNFPSFNIETMPPVSNGDGEYLRQRANIDQYRRLMRFIAIWGNASAKEESINKKICLGGIDKEIYKELGLSEIEGITDKKIPEAKLNKKEILLEPSVSKMMSKKSNKLEQKEEVIKKIITEEQRRFDSGKIILDKWIDGEIIEIGATTSNIVMLTEARNELNKYLLSAINLQSKNVSFDNIDKILHSRKKNLVGFKNLTRGDDSHLKLPVSYENRNFLIAFLGYVTLGKKSWNFDGATEMLYNVQLQTEKLKPKLIKEVNKFKNNKIDYQKFAIVYEIYRGILFGLFQVSAVNEITLEQVLKNEICKIDDNNKHSEKWKSLIKIITRDKNDEKNRDVVIQYYNLVQGMQKSKKIFFDVVELRKEFNAIKKENFEINKKELELKDDIRLREDIRELLRSVLTRIDKVNLEESEKASKILSNLKRSLGDVENMDDDDIEDMIIKVKEFYEEIDKTQINIIPDGNINLVNKSSKKIIAAIKKINISKNKKGLEKLIAFSKDPIKDILPLEELLVKISNDLEKAEKEIDKRNKKISNLKYVKARYKNELNKVSEISNVLDSMEVAK